MALSEASLKNFPKKRLFINLALHYPSKFDSTLAAIRKELSEFKKDFEKLVSELDVSKHGNGMLEERVINMERQCWSNSQYSRQECVEVMVSRTLLNLRSGANGIKGI